MIALRLGPLRLGAPPRLVAPRRSRARPRPSGRLRAGVGRRPGPSTRLGRLRRARGARIAAVVLTSALSLALGWLWLRDSFLVSVDDVSVRGLSGSQAPAIRDALIGAARGMTTLHVRRGAVLSAVSGFPIVRDVRLSTSFPHGLRIDVIERPPIAVLSGPGARLPVAADGRVLRGLDPPAGLPTITARLLPAGTTVTDRRARAALALLAAAPAALRRAVTRVSVTPNRAVAVLRSRTTVYFGTPDRPHAKWAAVARVMADATSTEATYLDVRLPERPAAGVPGAQALFERAQAALQAGDGGLSAPATAAGDTSASTRADGASATTASGDSGATSGASPDAGAGASAGSGAPGTGGGSSP